MGVNPYSPVVDVRPTLGCTYLERRTAVQIVVLIRAQLGAAHVWFEGVQIVLELLVTD